MAPGGCASCQRLCVRVEQGLPVAVAQEGAVYTVVRQH